MSVLASPAANRFVGKLSLIFTASDVSTEQGRARERQRRIMLGAAASVLAKVISVSTGLISVPLTLHYLGQERYGMWVTMSSLIAMMSFADLGIGNGLLSLVASANGRDDRAEMRGYISSAYVTLSAIAVAIFCTFMLAYPFVDWYRIFNVQTEQARQEAGPALMALVACFCLAMPLGIVQRVQMGLQKGFMASIWQCFSSLIALAAVLLVIHFKAPLPLLVIAFAGAPALANLVNSLFFFLFLERDVMPGRKFISSSAARSIAGTGILFFILQIVAAVSYSSDSIIIAQLLGAASVSQYAVPERLFALIGTILSMMLAPLWPAYGEAIVRGDHVWVKRILRRSILISAVVAAVGSIPLVLFGRTIINFWVGEAVDPNFALLIGFAVWKVVEAVCNALAVFLNGAKIINTQVIIAVITGAVAIGLKVVLVNNIGLMGAVWATSIAFSLFALIPYYFIFRKWEKA